MNRSLALAIVLSSCLGRGEAARTSALIVRDSVGIRVLEAPSGAVPGEVEFVEVSFSSALPEFGDILDVALGPDGHVVVLDPLGPHVVVLDSTGAERARFGGEGDGPGEFRAPGLTEVVVLGDTVVVPDLMRQRVTLFDLDGRVLQVVPVPGKEGLAVDWRGAGGGRLVFRRVSLPQRLEMLFLGGPSFEDLMALSSLSLPAASGPLAPLPVWCRLADGGLVLGRTDQYSLRVIAGGATTSLINGSVEPRPLTDADMAHLDALLQESLSRRLGGAVEPERVRQLLEQTPLPEEAPQIAELRCPSGAEVWVQRALSVTEMGVDILRVGSSEGWGGGGWDVFDHEAATLRRVHLPPGAQLTRITDRMLVGYASDDFDRKLPVRWVRR